MVKHLICVLAVKGLDFSSCLLLQLPTAVAASMTAAAAAPRLLLPRPLLLLPQLLLLLLPQGGDANLRLAYVQYGLYYLLTCGGFNSGQDVAAAAAAYRALPGSNPQYAAAGLVQLRLQLLEVRAGEGGGSTHALTHTHTRRRS